MSVFKELFEDMKKDEVGARSQELLENITTSDLPYLLTGAALDRALLKAYREFPADWEQYVYTEKVRDFRTVERLMEYGGDGALESVAQQAPYPYEALGEDKYTFSVAKFGRKIGFSFEAFQNDDLSALKRIPEKLARAARRTELKLITSLLCNSGGPNPALFDDTVKKNLGEAPLSITSLTAAFDAIGEQKDPSGEPFFVSRFHLIVPPSLEITAKNILEAIELTYLGESDVEYKTNNWIKQRITLHVNPYLPAINETSGDTAWYILPDPADIFSLVFARLTGHEEPEIFMKNPNAIKLGGGQDPFNGDFDHDSIEYKVRHICGAAIADWRGSYASDGSGSTT